MSKRFDYAKEHDIFAVHNGFQEGDKFFGNEMIGDLVLDVSTQKRIVGIEVLNASQYLEKFGVDEEILSNLIDVDLTATLHSDGATVTLVLKTKKATIPIKIAVQLETPLPI